MLCTKVYTKETLMTVCLSCHHFVRHNDRKMEENFSYTIIDASLQQRRLYRSYRPFCLSYHAANIIYCGKSCILIIYEPGTKVRPLSRVMFCKINFNTFVPVDTLRSVGEILRSSPLYSLSKFVYFCESVRVSEILSRHLIITFRTTILTTSVVYWTKAIISVIEVSVILGQSTLTTL